MPEDGKRPRRDSNNTERKDKKLWIFLPILLVFVSITSFIAGTRIGKDMEYHLGQMLDTIVLSPDEETVDENHIDFSGQIHNPDGTPCAGQLVELHSDPMRTRTDSEGIFYFSGVEVGEHHLIMLDESEQEISQIAVRIERGSTISYGVVERAANTIHLEVPDRAVGLHIHIQLDEKQGMVVESEVFTRKAGDTYRDTAGNEVTVNIKKDSQDMGEPVPESGEGLLDQDNMQDGNPGDDQAADHQSREASEAAGKQKTPSPDGSPTAAQESFPAVTEPAAEVPEESMTEEIAGSSEPETSVEAGSGGSSGDDSGGSDSGSSGTHPTRPTEPVEPTEPIDPTKPSDPTEPDPTDPLHVSVQEKGGPVWTQNTIISLFADRTGAGKDRKLMPGSKGSYAFLVSNQNAYPVIYRMKISAPQGQLLLPLRYRLKSDGVYLCGNNKTWLTAEQLATASVKLEPDTEKEYLLEWQWLFDGGDDAYDTEIGSSDNLEYQVIVTIIIEQILS